MRITLFKFDHILHSLFLKLNICLSAKMRNNQLTSQQQDSLQLFREITQITDDNICIDILNHNRWDVDLAVEECINNRSSTNRNGNSHEIRAARDEPIRTTQQGIPNVFATLLAPLQYIFTTNPPSNPDLVTRKFKDEFDLKYGSNHPIFFERSYNAAVSHANRGYKFLLVYLHSPLHENTNRFCR